MVETDRKFCIFGRNCAAFWMLLLLIVTIYSNTFNASWHFDDAGNILENPRLHIKDLSVESLRGTFHAAIDNGRYEGRGLFRPVSSLSFALNWYWGKDNVTGYHVVNILIHFLTAFFLYLAVIHLFKSPRLKDLYNGNEHFIALLTSVLWAANPIQIQAVTYIVQRMASLCAMFYVMSLYFYIRGRNETGIVKRVAFLAACFGALILSVGSKENGALLPVALCLVEIVFYRDLGLEQERRRIAYIAIIGGVALLGLSLYMLRGDLFSFMQGYGKRPFTLAERLLTEPRIILLYLSQMFYPVSSRFSLDHDIVISKSLFEPITTIFALLAILALIALGLFSIRKKPVVAFGILFFFLNHAVESTILPLELIFEHRNYLPSLFVFFPAAMGLSWLIDKYRQDNRIMSFVVAGFATIWIASSGLATYTRNWDWANDKTLWEDAMVKAPQNERPPHNLALEYYKKIGDQDRVLELLTRSLNLKSYTSRIYKDGTLLNIANVFVEKKQYEKAVALLHRSLEINPNNEVARYNLILQLINTNQLSSALQHSNVLVQKNESNIEWLTMKGYVLIKSGWPDEALTCFRRALTIDPDNGKALLYAGVSLNRMGRHEAADHFLKRAHQLSPSSIEICFCLIENSIQSGNRDRLDHYLELLVARFSLDNIISKLSGLSADPLSVPISERFIAPKIAEKVTEKLKSIQ